MRDDPVINIAGEKVALGPLRRGDGEAMVRWYNDFATIRTYGPLPRPVTLEEWQKLVERASAAEGEAWFSLYALPDLRLVGFAGLDTIDYENRKAEYLIFIGDPAARGKGLGTETTRLILDFAFFGLGLNSVYLRVYAYNAAGVRAYERAGFKVAGRLRQSKLMGGRLWDTIYMDCLAEEFGGGAFSDLLQPDLPR